MSRSILIRGINRQLHKFLILIRILKGKQVLKLRLRTDFDKKTRKPSYLDYEAENNKEVQRDVNKVEIN